MPAELLGVTANNYLRPIQYRGLQGYCTGWAGDREGTVYASLSGRVTAVTGIWAAFQESITLKVTYDQYLTKRPKVEGAKYHTLRVRLPESDWLHLVLIHTQATMHNLHDQDCYVLSATPDPPLEAFWIQWNNALPLPAFQEWAPRLWKLGRYGDLIVPCDAEGTYCWRIRANGGAWGAVLEQITMEGGANHDAL
jgi:hypothetical protein